MVKDNPQKMDPFFQEILDRMLIKDDPEPQRRCAECKDTGWLDSARGRYQCKCLLAEIAQQKYERLIREANMDDYDHMTFESYDPQHPSQETAHKVMQDSDVKCFYLVGNVGLGKTHLTSALVNRSIREEMTPALVVSAKVLFHNLLSGEMPDRLQKLEKFGAIPGLVIDDLGMEGKTVAVAETRLALFDMRYKKREKCWTSITSRYRQEYLMQACGYNIDTVDRIRGLTAELLLEGKSYRRPPKIKGA